MSFKKLRELLLKKLQEIFLSSGLVEGQRIVRIVQILLSTRCPLVYHGTGVNATLIQKSCYSIIIIASHLKGRALKYLSRTSQICWIGCLFNDVAGISRSMIFLYSPIKTLSDFSTFQRLFSSSWLKLSLCNSAILSMKGLRLIYKTRQKCKVCDENGGVLTLITSQNHWIKPAELLQASYKMKSFYIVQVGGHPGVGPGYAGGIISLSWLGNSFPPPLFNRAEIGRLDLCTSAETASLHNSG